MLRFHPLVIAGRALVADDAIALTFAVPPTLADEFRFHAGQHLALRQVIDGQEERRTYSIVNPEGSAALTIGVRVQKEGRMSEHLAQHAKVGDTIDVLTPNGSFRAQGGPGPRRYAAFASGSGITPVLSIAATALASDPGSRFQLWYGNTESARTMFLEEVMALKDRNLTRFSVAFVMSREPQEVDWLNGHIDGAKLREFARHDLSVPDVDEFFVCGPGSMGDEIPAVLAKLGAKGPIHVERFTPVSGDAASAAPSHASRPAVARPAGASAEVTVVMDGRRRRFTMPRDGEVILDAAGRAGLDLPFSCRAGVCSTCRAKLVSGSAEMEHNVALEDWEVESGYILCCQARPTSPELEISYDE
ncbi:MAG TPA: 2Fe-2S iron-sulfur cluster-binding protein [Steroidobacteraceae bacterium]|nr:2Fe-2S iron-sulfur cluster-binding protein [Steroidobacteraceae bacterium]